MLTQMSVSGATPQVSVTLIDVTDKKTQLGLIHGMMSTTQAAPTTYTLT